MYMKIKSKEKNCRRTQDQTHLLVIFCKAQSKYIREKLRDQCQRNTYNAKKAKDKHIYKK